MNHVENKRNQIARNIVESYSHDTIQATSAADFIEKGKKANLGEVREWGGGKFQKTVNGWIPYRENGGKTEKHGEKEEKSPVTKDSIMEEYDNKLKAHSAEYGAKLKANLDARNKLSDSFKKETDALEKERDELYEKVFLGEISDDEYKTKSKESHQKLKDAYDKFNSEDGKLQDEYKKLYDENLEGAQNIFREERQKQKALQELESKKGSKEIENKVKEKLSKSYSKQLVEEKFESFKKYLKEEHGEDPLKVDDVEGWFEVYLVNTQPKKSWIQESYERDPNWQSPT